MNLTISLNLRHTIIALLVHVELSDQKPATTGERLINSHRKLREGRKTKRRAQWTSERGEFRIHTVAYDLWHAISARAIRYNINNYHRFGRMQSWPRLWRDTTRIKFDRWNDYRFEISHNRESSLNIVSIRKPI